MKISVIMVDAGFRENAYAAKYFSEQDFPEEQYEILWVDFYDKIHPDVLKEPKVTPITLRNPPDQTYHSSKCFNEGIKRARGEFLIIPDADLIVESDFLSTALEYLTLQDRIAVYGYRYNDTKEDAATSNEFDELRSKCTITGPTNYGGCLCVSKALMQEINGYEEHAIFEGGFHANGFDIYTRLHINDVAILWGLKLKLYHRWHPFSLIHAKEYELQRKLIQTRQDQMNPMAIDGLDKTKNITTFHIEASASESPPTAITKRILRKIRG